VQARGNGGELHRNEEVDHFLLHDDQHLYKLDQSALDSALRRIVNVGTGGYYHDPELRRNPHLDRPEVETRVRQLVDGVHGVRYG
jgi:hypothetical protein